MSSFYYTANFIVNSKLTKKAHIVLDRLECLKIMLCIFNALSGSATKPKIIERSKKDRHCHRMTP